MPFAAGLRDSLQSRRGEVRAELTSGESLKHVLGKHLLAVEAMSAPDLITSILLLSHDGKRLSHGAAPRLPPSYCDAIDGSEIGPRAGSCGTAAYHGRPVYVTDIATDPLWSDYRHIALPHGLRSCWSTPIRDPDGTVIGTFAIYRPTVSKPTKAAIEAIDMITEHVAQAIVLARDVQDLEPSAAVRSRRSPNLQIVGNDGCSAERLVDPSTRLLGLAARLQTKVADLERFAKNIESQEAAKALRKVAELSERLADVIRSEVDEGSEARAPK